MSGLLFPELTPEETADGWQPDVPMLRASDVLQAISKRHPMDGFNGEPGRWVFATEVPQATGGVGGLQRFDAVAIGLVPSVRYARVVYEVKVSRGDWLRELRPQAIVRDQFGEQRVGGMRGAAVLRNIDELGDRYQVTEGRKWDAALAVSTEYWIAAPPRVVQLHELPPEAGLVEVRMWGGELRPRVVRPAPVRATPNPGPEFWAVMLRKAAHRDAAA